MDTAENFLAVSALFYQSAEFEQSIAAAEEALRLQPSYAEAYGNIAAAYRGLEQWDQAIQAARKALRMPTVENGVVTFSDTIYGEDK